MCPIVKCHVSVSCCKVSCNCCRGVLETLIIRHFPSFGCSESEDDEEEDWSNVSSPDDADGHDQEMEQIKCEELEITAVEDPNSSEAAIVIDSDDGKASLSAIRHRNLIRTLVLR